MFRIVRIKSPKKKNPAKRKARKNPFAKGKPSTIKSKVSLKGKRKGQVFQKDGKTYLVMSYITKTGKRVRLARRVNLTAGIKKRLAAR